MTCLPHPLYADDTTADEWLAAVGAVAGLLSSTNIAGPFSKPAAALALAFGTGSAIAASWGDGDFDWSGFGRSMAVLGSSTVLYGTLLGPAHVRMGKAIESGISGVLTKFPEDLAAAFISNGLAGYTGAKIVDPLLNDLLDLPCTGNDQTYGDALGSALQTASPLVIDLDMDNKPDLIPIETSPVFFTVLNTAPDFAQKTGWVSPEDGLLALDKNLNGVIDGRSELFGNTPDGVFVGFRNGFENLAQYDHNHDNIINNQDTVYGSLRVWQDSNTNGYSEPNELCSLSDADITAINVASTSYEQMVEGQRVSDISTVTYGDGANGKIWDVWFDVNNINSVYKTTQPFSPDVFDLRNWMAWGILRIYGGR
jgi:hypothetical protein